MATYYYTLLDPHNALPYLEARLTEYSGDYEPTAIRIIKNKHGVGNYNIILRKVAGELVESILNDGDAAREDQALSIAARNRYIESVQRTIEPVQVCMDEAFAHHVLGREMTQFNNTVIFINSQLRDHLITKAQANKMTKELFRMYGLKERYGWRLVEEVLTKDSIISNKEVEIKPTINFERNVVIGGRF